VALQAEGDIQRNPRLSMMYQKTNEVSFFRQIVIGSTKLKCKELA
jgi:hypothetical protein